MQLNYIVAYLQDNSLKSNKDSTTWVQNWKLQNKTTNNSYLQTLQIKKEQTGLMILLQN